MFTHKTLEQYNITYKINFSRIGSLVCFFLLSFFLFLFFLFVWLFVYVSFFTCINRYSIHLVSHQFLYPHKVLSVYARVAERSKAIVSGTILFEVAGSNPASCILGSGKSTNRKEKQKEM